LLKNHVSIEVASQTLINPSLKIRKPDKQSDVVILTTSKIKQSGNDMIDANAGTI
jgi:hypothetical protein